MKSISSRQFRLTFGEITEPVIVTLQKDGEYRALGVWTPQDAIWPLPERWEGFQTRGFGTSRPAPKRTK